ncbi:PEP-CTERM sorting domain-containing protein [Haloferula sp.]|uniref:PEP-CTERM sorting domain-containing protein n=1 Tax=Haloferula sp. TaxID=2497595 RepID=UPI003C773BA9
MKNPIAPLLGSIFLASALSLSAQTFTEDISGTPANNTFERVDGLTVGNILFNNTEGGGIPDPFEIDPVGATITEVTTATGTFTAFDICAEMFVGPNDSSSYQVTQGFGSLNAGQQVLVAKLFSNTLVDFFVARDGGDRTEAAIIGAALQMAFWEIVEDPTFNSTPSLDENSPNAGNISISGYTASYSGDTQAAMIRAQTYLDQLDTWTDNGGLTYFYADNATEQDRLWVTFEAIPEPSTALLAMLGMITLLRRKRA